MNETLKLSLALGVTCALAAGILTFAYDRTKPAQDRAETAERQKALGVVLPEFDNHPIDDTMSVTTASGVCTFYRARRNGDKGEIVGFAGEGRSPKGYGGEIRVLIGINPDRSLRAVLVTAHKETPGLGTQVTDRKAERSFWDLFRKSPVPSSPPLATTALPPCPYLDQYVSAGYRTSDAPFRTTKDGGRIDAVSGATVSSRAVAEAVSSVCRAFEEHASELMRP